VKVEWIVVEVSGINVWMWGVQNIVEWGEVEEWSVQCRVEVGNVTPLPLPPSPLPLPISTASTASPLPQPHDHRW